MSENQQIQIAKRGVVTIPQSLRKRYKLKTGDTLTLIDLGGVFVLNPHRSIIDGLAEEISHELLRKGETLESMLKVLSDRRKRYGRRKAS